MGLFYGPIGFSDTIEEPIGSGIWIQVPIEKNYRGEVQRNTKRLDIGDNINPNLNISNTISVIADPFFNNHLNSVRYIKWLGGYWEITSVDVVPPRLVLSIGGVYNGPTVESPDDSGEHPRIS